MLLRVLPNERIRGCIQAVVTGACTPSELNELVRISHALARSFITGKRSAGTLTASHGLSIHDLAYDCIADLFQLDESRNPIHLRTYFSGVNVDSCNNAELLSHLRRLVFSKVNHGFFRMMGEADPSLSKILRNIKLSVHSLNNFTELERFGEPCIAPSLSDTLEYLPPFDKDELTKRFLESTSGTDNIPGLLAVLSKILLDQEEYCRLIPLVTVGLLIRSAYMNKQHGAIARDDDPFMLSNEVQDTIRDACKRLRERTLPKYVGKGKVDESTFHAYFATIEECLLETFLHGNGKEDSLFETASKHIPTLTKDDYRRYHRNQLEYLFKLTKKEAIKRFEVLK